MPNRDSFLQQLQDFECVKVVTSFEALVQARFSGKVNAVCWVRTLEGDFEEIVRSAGPIDEITGLEEDDLDSLELSPSGCAARKVLCEDLRLLREAKLAPNLDIIPTYPRAASDSLVPIDVYDLHADSATVMADTFLCSYTVAASEGVRNEDATRYIDDPRIRAQLLNEYGGADDQGFHSYLSERFYDLHYRQKQGATAFNFGLGNLWRISTQCPGSPVAPCIHRAPTTKSGDHSRLLLIS